MKNDKQIAFTELSFQPFPEKFVTIIQYKTQFCWISESLQRWYWTLDFL